MRLSVAVLLLTEAAMCADSTPSSNKKATCALKVNFFSDDRCTAKKEDANTKAIKRGWMEAVKDGDGVCKQGQASGQFVKATCDPITLNVDLFTDNACT